MDAPARNESAVVRFDISVFSLDAIKRAAYRFVDRFSVEIEVSVREVACTLHFLSPQSAAAIEASIADFRSEVLDQDLRSSIGAETAAYRNAILAFAFSGVKPKIDE